MGNRGRYGKYGESKRLDRLRKSGSTSSPYSRSQGPPPRKRKDGDMRRVRVTVRPAGGGEAGFIRSLSEKAFSPYGPYEDTVIQWFSSPSTLSLTAVLRGRPVGFAMIDLSEDSDDGKGDAELLAIAVEPENRRKGIGKRLLTEIEKAGSALEVERVFLHTAVENQTALRLFRRCGFRESTVKKGFYPNGQDALEMVKRLQGREEFGVE